MVDSILTYFGIKSKQFIQKWQYLLLQEEFRLCQRIIHPFIKNMDFRHYVPPAIYFVGQQEIISDALCQLCLNQLSVGKAYLNVHHYEGESRQLKELNVASGTIFEDPIN